MTKLYPGYYEGYRIVKWDTPISTISYGDFLVVEKLLVNPMYSVNSSEEQDALIIELKNNDHTISFSFPRFIALRIIEELYFSGGFEGDLSQLGNTLIVENSPWIAKLRETSPPFDIYETPDTKHYMILTESYTVEIISDYEPVVEQSN